MTRRPVVVSAITALVAAVLAVTVPGTLPVAFLVIPAWMVSGVAGGRLNRLPAAARRVLDTLDPEARRSVATVETLASWPLMVAVLALGIGATAALASRSQVLVSLGALAIATPLVLLRRPVLPHVTVVIPTDEAALLEDGSDDRVVAMGLVSSLRAAGQTVTLAGDPPHLFRALAGWNLGLGLDAEQAGWAGQLARRLGLGPILADPGPTVGPADARKLAVCRALAGGGEVVVLDEPALGLEPHEVEELAGVVSRALGDRRLIVVTSQPFVHRAFLSKVRSRP